MSNRTFEQNLKRELKDPECAAYFANAQVESAKELLKCGIIKTLDTSSGTNKTKHFNWRVK